MVRFIQPTQLRQSLKWRLTATSDEDGSGHWGNPECFHNTPEQAQSCDACDEYVSQQVGMPSRKMLKEMKEHHVLSELERLKDKYEPGRNPQ